jgi:predicted Zn-ribbon and HTH transcriptional regulator
MKSKLMTHYCMDKTCDYEETTHKIRDGIRCPKCKGPVNSYYPKKNN